MVFTVLVIMILSEINLTEQVHCALYQQYTYYTTCFCTHGRRCEENPLLSESMYNKESNPQVPAQHCGRVGQILSSHTGDWGLHPVTGIVFRFFSMIVVFFWSQFG